MTTKILSVPAFSPCVVGRSILLCAWALAALACGGTADSGDDGTQSGNGALSAGGASASTDPALVAAGEYAIGSKHLYVTESAQDHLAFVIDVGSETGTGDVAGVADRVKPSVFRFVSDQCTLDFTSSSGAVQVSETENCSALHGASVDFEGRFAEAPGAPSEGKYSSENGALQVKTLQGGGLDFDVAIASAAGHTGDVAGRATSSTAPSLFTFKSGDCSLNLHFGSTALVVEQSATCGSESGGLSFSDVYKNPTP
jgi:hypothetical protein